MVGFHRKYWLLGNRRKVILVIFLSCSVCWTCLYFVSNLNGKAQLGKLTVKIPVNDEQALEPTLEPTLKNDQKAIIRGVAPTTGERSRSTTQATDIITRNSRPRTLLERRTPPDKPSTTVTTSTPRPAFYTRNNGEKVYNIVDLSNQFQIDKLKPEDKQELIERRKKGMLDGMKLKLLENLMNFIDLPQVSCEKRSSLIILVNSYCGHKDRRNAIRQSWGNFSKSLNVNTIFFVGQCQEAIAENKATQDIVQAQFVDNYYNLTLKSLSRIKWFNEHCSNSDLVLLCDDDVLVDSDAIINYYPRYKGLNSLCNKNHYMPILREKKSKWYVPRWLLDGEYFPYYCSGFAYMFNSSILPELYQKSLDLPYIFVDDAFVSGFAMHEINKEIHGDDRFILGDKSLFRCDYHSIFASHRYVGEEMIKIWKKRREKCTPEATYQ